MDRGFAWISGFTQRLRWESMRGASHMIAKRVSHMSTSKVEPRTLCSRIESFPRDGGLETNSSALKIVIGWVHRDTVILDTNVGIFARFKASLSQLIWGKTGPCVHPGGLALVRGFINDFSASLEKRACRSLFGLGGGCKIRSKQDCPRMYTYSIENFSMSCDKDPIGTVSKVRTWAND